MPAPRCWQPAAPTGRSAGFTEGWEGGSDQAERENQRSFSHPQMPCPSEQAWLQRPCSKHPRAAGTHRCRLAAESLQRALALPASTLGSQTCERASLGCLQGGNGAYGAAGVAPVAGTPSGCPLASSPSLCEHNPAAAPGASSAGRGSAEGRPGAAGDLHVAGAPLRSANARKQDADASEPDGRVIWDGVAQCPNLVARKPACKCQGSIHNCISRRSQRGALQPGCSHPAACNPCHRHLPSYFARCGLQANLKFAGVFLGCLIARCPIPPFPSNHTHTACLPPQSLPLPACAEQVPMAQVIRLRLMFNLSDSQYNLLHRAMPGWATLQPAGGGRGRLVWRLAVAAGC